MKGALTLLLALLAAPLVGAGDAPRLVVEPAAFDFGEVLPQRTLTKEFRLSNHGEADLLIERVATSCGCTLVDDAYDKRLAPGTSTRLRVELATRDDRGHVVRRVVIRSNDPGTQPREIRLEATVVAPKAAE